MPELAVAAMVGLELGAALPAQNDGLCLGLFAAIKD